MATIESWAVDMADVGAVYPFQGTEFILVVVAYAAWIVWHVWQMGGEQRQHKDEVQRYGSAEELKKHLDGD